MFKNQPPVKDNKAVYQESLRLIRGYGNKAVITWSCSDLSIVFGTLLPRRTKKNEGIIELHTSMSIPWTQAKFLSDQLVEAIAEYERENGPLTEPKVPFIK